MAARNVASALAGRAAAGKSAAATRASSRGSHPSTSLVDTSAISAPVLIGQSSGNSVEWRGNGHGRGLFLKYILQSGERTSVKIDCNML